MPGGLITLVTFGKQNVIINGNPQITYFYKSFRRHSHFSMENISIPLEGPNELNLDMPMKLRVKVQRFADLARNCYLTVRLPAIYSKISPDREIPYEFQWTKQLGARMIQSVACYVGGSKIQEFPGEWIAVRAQLDQETVAYAQFQELIGDVPEMNNPANGFYSDASSGMPLYPNVVATATQSQTNNPSIPSRNLRIPLPFWFSESLGNALPLKALQYHEVEIQVTFQPLRNLYTLLDQYGCRVRYGYQNYNEADFSATNPETLSDVYNPSTDQNGAPQNFYTDAGYAIPQTEYFNLNPQMEIEYIYLTDSERSFIAEHPLQYIITQVQTFTYQGIKGRTKFDLDAHNMVRRMIWFARRSDTLVYRNDYLNCTNWKYANQQPYLKGTLAASTIYGTSGVIIPGGQRSILQTARILCEGNEIMEEKPAEYFELQQPYDNLVGGPEGIVGQDTMGPLYVLSFAAKGSDLLQPSGSLNVSLINNFQLEVNPYPINPAATYTYDFTVYVESVNFLAITNGMGSLQFAV